MATFGINNLKRQTCFQVILNLQSEHTITISFLGQHMMYDTLDRIILRKTEDVNSYNVPNFSVLSQISSCNQCFGFIILSSKTSFISAPRFYFDAHY